MTFKLYIIILILVFAGNACNKKTPVTKSELTTEHLDQTYLEDMDPNAIIVTPAQLTLALGESTRLSVSGLYPYRRVAPITKDLKWTSADPSILDIDADGIAKALKVGSTLFRVENRGISQTVNVTITEAVEMQLILLPESNSLSLSSKLGVFQSQDFKLEAFALRTDGQLIDISKEVVWEIEDENSLVQKDPLHFTAKSPGEYILKARYGLLYNRHKVSVASLPLSIARLESTINNFVMRYGDPLPIPVRAIMNDDSIVTDISTAKFIVDPGKLEVQGTQLIPRGLGYTTLKVMMGNTSLDLAVYIREPDVVSLAITPDSFPMSLGQISNFTAKATLTDGSVVDITTVMHSTALNTSVATSSGHSIQAVANGATILRVFYKGVSKDALVNVGNAILDHLTITPSSFNLAAGASASFTVTGVMTDGQTLPLTNLATAHSLSVSKAEVTGTGVVQGKAQGTTKLSVTYINPSDNVNLAVSADISIEAPYLTGIVFDPPVSGKAAGRFEDFKVKGRYSDNTEVDITTLVDITADIGGPTYSYCARIARTTDNRIRVTGTIQGAIRVIATYGGISGNVVFTSLPKEMDRVNIQRDGSTSSSSYVLKGDSAYFKAYATFSDGSVEDVTFASGSRTVTWSPVDATRVNFVAGAGKMLFSALFEGSAGVGITVIDSGITKSNTFGMDIYIPCTGLGKTASYFCYYMGDPGKSCSETCSAQTPVRAVHSATDSYSGKSAVDGGACQDMIENIFTDITSKFNGSGTAPTGIGCAVYVKDDINIGIRQKTAATSNTAFEPDFRRLCSCE